MASLAGAERGSCISQIALNIHSGRVRATEHALLDPFDLFERRHGLTEFAKRWQVESQYLTLHLTQRGGSVQPAGDFRRGSASSSNPSEIELTRSGSDSKARSPFWGGASP